MLQPRSTFEDELLKLQLLVLELANEVKTNGELLLEFLQNKDIDKISKQIKDRDKLIDKARWEVHDFGDQLLILQQPVARDFRQIVTSTQITDNYERIGDHFKRTSKILEKASVNDIEIPKEIIDMASLGLNMLSESIEAYRNIFQNKTNNISSMDDEVDKLYKQTVKKLISLIKAAPDEKIESFSKLLFVAQSFERAADHAAKVGDLINFAVTGKRR
jgi:phosphate transport system protein